MTEKPVVPREQAHRDSEQAIGHYAREAGEKIALGFIDEIENAFRAIVRRPATGSPRYAYELDLPDLRARMTKRYPYLVFYVERDDRIDVWRVLHAQQEIPAWIHTPDDV